MLKDIDPDVALDSAIALHESGQLDVAEAAYRAILQTNPNEPDALNLLGLILQDQGKSAEAIALIARALEIDPAFPEALTNLARAKRAVGDADAAVALARRAVALEPDLAEAQFQWGRALLDQRQWQEAVAPLKRAVALDPSLLDGHISLGNAEMARYEFHHAITAFQAALAINPDRLEPLVNVAACLQKLDRVNEALAYQRHAVTVAPDDPVPHAAIGGTLRQLGDLQGSIEACLRATTLAPDYHDALILLGNNSISLGEFDQAEAWFHQALSVSAGSGSARAGLAAIGRGSADEADIQRLSAEIADPRSSDHGRISAGFALGSVLDREGRYDEAFEAFSSANGFVRNQHRAQARAIDPLSLRRYVAWAKQVFSPALFADMQGLGDPTERLVFVVGMPRSGTTLVEQILASHPDVFGAGELTAMPATISALDGGRSHVAPARWDRERIGVLAAAHSAELARLSAGALRVVDKLPDNVQLLGQLALLFPNARVILCRRDLRDVCLSCYFQFFNAGSDWSFDLADCAARASQIEELVAHWRKVLPLRILEVDYESVVGDLDGQSRRLVDFVGLDWDPACLDFHRTARPVLTASQWQVRQPLYATSVGRWRNYRTHIGPLLDGLRGLLPADGSGDIGDAKDQTGQTQCGGINAGHRLSNTAAFTDLAAGYLAAKAPAEALKAAQQAVAADPNSALGYILLGIGYMELEQPGDAVVALRTAVCLAPDRADARTNLASALSRAQQYEEAREAWRQALILDPANVDCLAAMAVVLVELGQPQEAVAQLCKATALQPENAMLQHRLATARFALQDAAGTEVPARLAVHLDPQNPAYLLCLAECLSSLGQFKEAAVLFRQAGALSPHSARAQFALTKMGEELDAVEDLPRLRFALADATQHETYRADAGFALARALQSAGDYDGAFASCAEANRLIMEWNRQQGRVFDRGGLRQKVDAMIAGFTPGYFAATQCFGNPSEVPVFIVGMPRSGTTLVEQIAASHPRVFGRGETKTIKTATDELIAAAARHGRAMWLPAEVATTAEAVLAEIRSVGGEAIRVTDKMPDNITYLGQIATLFPRARIILCRRDPRDIGVSCFFESFTDSMEWTFDLSDIAARAYEIERLAVHWRNVLPLPMLEMNYEELVGDLEGQSRRLIDFLGLAWDPACLNFHGNKRQIMTASHWQVRQPLYSSSVGRWRHYRRHLSPLIAGLKGLVPTDD